LEFLVVFFFRRSGFSPDVQLAKIVGL